MGISLYTYRRYQGPFGVQGVQVLPANPARVAIVFSGATFGAVYLDIVPGCTPARAMYCCLKDSVCEILYSRVGDLVKSAWFIDDGGVNESVVVEILENLAVCG